MGPRTGPRMACDRRGRQRGPSCSLPSGLRGHDEQRRGASSKDDQGGIYRSTRDEQGWWASLWHPCDVCGGEAARRRHAGASNTRTGNPLVCRGFELRSHARGSPTHTSNGASQERSPGPSCRLWTTTYAISESEGRRTVSQGKELRPLAHAVSRSSSMQSEAENRLELNRELKEALSRGSLAMPASGGAG